MNPQRHDTWVDASETISRAELSRSCQVSPGELDELIEYGALAPVQKHGQEIVFSAACAPALRTACKLRRDYDLDLFTVALLMDYLNRIERLEREVRSLQAHLPAHLVKPHRDGPQPWREPHAHAGEPIERVS
jgi:chaperone modulatory protein CbpM